MLPKTQSSLGNPSSGVCLLLGEDHCVARLSSYFLPLILGLLLCSLASSRQAVGRVIDIHRRVLKRICISFGTETLLHDRIHGYVGVAYRRLEL